MSNLPELNLFMLCEKVNKKAFAKLPKGFYFRYLQKNEIDKWFALPFDNKEDAEQYKSFMQNYFQKVYGKKQELFFSSCLVACDDQDNIVGSCFLWRAYGKITTVHWLKVIKGFEGQGIGRALLTKLLQDAKQTDFPILLHTQPESFRAIKLYADFGFKLLINKKIGFRQNDIAVSLDFLRENMGKHFDTLQFSEAPKYIDEIVSCSTLEEF